MPSTYAHYRLGQQVRRELEGNERKIIEKYPQLYLIGLHGPDILFYYKPLRPNPVNQIGYDLHGHSGKEFFERAKNIINSQKEKEPFLAYTYGVLNHFALDVSCHGEPTAQMENANTNAAAKFSCTTHGRPLRARRSL